MIFLGINKQIFESITCQKVEGMHILVCTSFDNWNAYDKAEYGGHVDTASFEEAGEWTGQSLYNIWFIFFTCTLYLIPPQVKFETRNSPYQSLKSENSEELGNIEFNTLPNLYESHAIDLLSLLLGFGFQLCMLKSFFWLSSSPLVVPLAGKPILCCTCINYLIGSKHSVRIFLLRAKLRSNSITSLFWSRLSFSLTKVMCIFWQQSSHCLHHSYTFSTCSFLP